jgi:hypothetical protein
LIKKEADDLKECSLELLYSKCKEKILKLLKELKDKNEFKYLEQIYQTEGNEDNIINDLKDWFYIITETIKNDFNFYLNDCECLENIVEHKRIYVEETIKSVMGTHLSAYFELKKLLNKIEIKEKLDKFISDIDKHVLNIQNIKTDGQVFKDYLNRLGVMIEDRLIKTKSKVWLDYEHYVEYPKIFIELNGHDLEDLIYDSILEKNEGEEKIGKKIIDYFREPTSRDIFIPFELQKKFENLAKIYIELTDQNFEKRVFNSSVHWFVKFLKISGTELHDSKFSET